MPGRLSGGGKATGGKSKLLSECFAILAVALSLFALVIVIGNVAAGAPPERDENAWAHLFQLSMASQLPLVLLFLATADWTRWRRVLFLFCAQIFAAGAAFGALAWSGY